MIQHDEDNICGVLSFFSFVVVDKSFMVAETSVPSILFITEIALESFCKLLLGFLVVIQFQS